MEIRSLFKKIFGNKKETETLTEFKTLNGFNAYYSLIGEKIYDNKVVREVIDRIATNCAKLVPKHVQNGRHVRGDIDFLLEYEPNPIMTKYDFIYKVISQLYAESNAFVYIQKDSKGMIKGFFPVLAHEQKLFENKAGDIFLRFRFINNQYYTIRYDRLIHLRKFYNENDIFGESSKVLRTDMQASLTASEGTKNAIMTASAIRGILKYENAMLKPKDIKENKEQFEKDFLSMDNKSGIAALDGKANFQAINLNPITLDEGQLKRLNYNIFEYFGVNEKIIDNSFNEEEWNAFYEGVLEPLAIQMGDEFTRKIFSTQAIKEGNRIVFSANRLQYASLNTKIKLIQTLMPWGTITIDEAREVIDMAPIGGEQGAKILQSLNNINTNIADNYQGGTE